MSTMAERDSETPRRRGRRSGGGGGGAGGGGRAGGRGGGLPLLPLLIVAGALVVAGIGALIVSSSYDTPREAAVLGGNLAINDGAGNPADLNANNSPTLVRNPIEQGNLVTVNRIDSPAYSCSLNVSFDGGGRWAQTPIPAPAGEEPKCFAPDAAFSSDGTLYVTYVTLEGPRQHAERGVGDVRPATAASHSARRPRRRSASRPSRSASPPIRSRPSACT